MENIFLLIPLFFVTAVIYSSAGFGGGSTYLALLVLFNMPYQSIPPIALLCNLIVVSGSLIHYHRQNLLVLRSILPFVILSIPAAFLGGMIPIGKTFFLILLGLSLLMASVRLFFVGKNQQKDFNTQISWLKGMFMGGGLGFVSGLIGIGGGIFLAPLLYLLRWGGARSIATASSLFIFVNSLAGMAGHFSRGSISSVQLLLPLAVAVFIGGQMGSRMSIKILPPRALQKITAVLIFGVSARIFYYLVF